MFRRQTLTAHYWTEAFEVTDADVEYLFSIMLEGEKPLTSLELARRLVQRRLQLEEAMWRDRLADGVLFQPKDAYTVGQKLIFPALDFSIGEVKGTRAGSSPEQGEFTVINVEFEDGVRREFASQLVTPHVLNVSNGHSLEELLEPADAEQLVAKYGEWISEAVEERLEGESDAVYAAGLWFLKSLLPDVSEAHAHLAEAVLDMNGGGPLAPEDILPVLDLPKEINPALQAFALNYVLYRDRRFDEVGAAGLVRWYLKRLEPEEVRETPTRLSYQEIPYDRSLLSPEAVALETEIADEFSPLPRVSHAPEEVSLTLIYPHRRSGTLPLNASLSAMFPTAYEAETVRIIFVDGETGDEYEGWLVRRARYVSGLDRFYWQHKLPIGVYVRVARTDDPGRYMISFDGYRPRTEWIRLVIPEKDRISFQNHKRAIGAAYDDLMVLGADDLERVDEVCETIVRQKRSLVATIRDLVPELARLTPQATVHAKTLYSAVNVLRRCPPGPILAALEAQPAFEHVGGNYWRLQQQD
ncbi:MAG: hypothetical protein JW910_15025 [Anaerolineae bacterium]|nr:hypothetical protein [Anaerolineae bacterium]